MQPLPPRVGSPRSGAPAPPTGPTAVPPPLAPPGPAPPVPAQRIPAERVESTSPARPRPGRLRLVLAVFGGVLALLCLGGAGIGYILYDGADASDRGAPDVVVDSYLRAFLVDRDDKRANLYVCQDGPALDELRSFRTDLADRERRFSIRIAITWGSLTVESTEVGTRVATDLRRTIADGSEQAQDRWQFDLVDRDGWRVCGARRIG